MPVIVTAAAKDAGMDDEKCEWRFFMPVAGPDRLPVDSLGELFEGLTEREGPEERDDVYVVVTNDVGVKRRGDKKKLEVKVRVKAHPPVDGVQGIEVWKKYKIGKKEVAAGGSSHLEEAYRVIGDHGLLTDQVQHRLGGEGKAEVVVTKRRLNAMHRSDGDTEGVQLEDCHLLASGTQWRSMAVEGTRHKIGAFLSSTPLGQSILALTTQPGVLLTGYPGWVLHLATSTQQPSQRPLPVNPYRGQRLPCATSNIAIVVCQHPHTRQYLAVEETKNRGWWLPAGHVDPNESFQDAARRETMEEAGLDVNLEGVLRVEHSLKGPTSARMRVVFYATPTDPHAPPKSVADEESVSARWVSVADLEHMRLRGSELLEWAKYLDAGGPVYPLSIFTGEHANVVAPQSRVVSGGTAAVSRGGSSQGLDDSSSRRGKASGKCANS